MTRDDPKCTLKEKLNILICVDIIRKGGIIYISNEVRYLTHDKRKFFSFRH